MSLVSAISTVSFYLVNSEFGKPGETVRTNLSGKKITAKNSFNKELCFSNSSFCNFNLILGSGEYEHGLYIYLYICLVVYYKQLNYVTYIEDKH